MDKRAFIYNCILHNHNVEESEYFKISSAKFDKIIQKAFQEISDIDSETLIGVREKQTRLKDTIEYLRHLADTDTGFSGPDELYERADEMQRELDELTAKYGDN